MKRIYTDGGIELTEKQIKNIRSMKRLLKNWDEDLQINCVAGILYIFLKGDTDQNPEPEMSDTGGFNPDNVAFMDCTGILADGGDW